MEKGVIQEEDRLEDGRGGDSYRTLDESDYDTVVTHRGITDSSLPDEQNPERKFSRAFIKSFVITALVLLVVGLGTVFIGARVERGHLRSAPTTESLYETGEVCAVLNETSPQFSTFAADWEASLDGFPIAHCGACGACSKVNDIKIMSQESNVLDFILAKCGSRKILGKDKMEKCLNEQLGFTDVCQSCFSDFVRCSVDYCKFTCLISKTQGRECVDCKEQMCGKDFLECSGVSRKTLGFIDYPDHKDESEVCSSLDIRWP